MSIDITGLPQNKATNNDRSSGQVKPGKGSSDTASAGSQNTSGGEDTVSLTGTAAKLRQLETALSELPVADQDRIDAVKRAVTNGTYEIDPQRIAAKMLDFERSLDQ
ncbi:MAG: flagellar biosynthesis anti-sigma factor FlgM [Gammaproteobacteria bacterium]|nr:flagellar biosynthesis anti-sigma factor FlgM [Gammaproteobacteria bacterium]